MPELRATELVIGYGDVNVLKSLSATLPESQITSIVGPNGSGKSTLLKALSRVLCPDRGDVVLSGQSIRATPTRELARLLSILPQDTRAPDGLTVEELVSYGRYPHRRLFSRDDDDQRMIEWALKVANLQDLRGRALSSLSGGQQQRVWIAMTLAQGAEILMLDEPTSHLDMCHQLEVMELLQKLNRESSKTIVMVLHDLNLAARYSGHMIVLCHGGIFAAGPPAEVMSEDMLMEAFRVQAEIVADPRYGVPMCIPYCAASPDDARSKGARHLRRSEEA